MRSGSILLIFTLSMSMAATASADRVLQRAEALQILQELTEQPRKTWIPAGTIQATHQEYGAPTTTDSTVIGREIQKAISEYTNTPNKRERSDKLQKMALDAIPFNVRYKLANEYTMVSRVTVKYDGARFYWEINMDSREDSVRPDASLAGNSKARDLGVTHRRWNKRRIFAWDGQKYTSFSASGNHAVVDTTGKLPYGVNGPLTAGLIPWGNGRYSYADLSAAETSAKETVVGGKTRIEMEVIHRDGRSMDLVLDPARGYAVESVVLTDLTGDTATYTCSGYKLFGVSWVPSTVTIERRDVANKLKQSEQWTFTSVSTAVPGPGSFDVPYGLNTIVEYDSAVTAKPAMYEYSHTADTDALLMQRLGYAATQNVQPQNCATAALQCVALQCGKAIPGGALASLVGPGGGTTLYEVKRLAQGQGLYCRAVKTDLATLSGLSGAKAILHIPGKNHLVVLDQVDDRDVRLIDLSSDKFYYRASVDFFPQEWSEGAALLVSDRPIAGQFTEIPDAVLAKLIGGAGWRCTDLLQEWDMMGCIYVSGHCLNAYTWWYERWGCAQATSGTCSETQMIDCQEADCIADPIYECTIDFDWTYYYTGACA